MKDEVNNNAFIRSTSFHMYVEFQKKGTGINISSRHYTVSPGNQSTVAPLTNTQHADEHIFHSSSPNLACLQYSFSTYDLV
jgi:hypothetical protein